MILKIYNDNQKISRYLINKECFYNKDYVNKVSYINSSNKENNALNIFSAYYSNSKLILFDATNKSINQKLTSLNIKALEEKENDYNIFNDCDFSFLFFTSGTTGNPLGVLKTKENIRSEIRTLSKLFSKYKIKRIITTVPFIHYYGFLMGLMYPLINDIDIVFKEHFLPNDLLNFIDDYSLVITTPLYIKSLNRINTSKQLSKSIFLSSTAPLCLNVIKEFRNKFSSTIIQLFGSTETGGIAYKYNDDVLWSILNSVNVNINKKNELIVRSDFVSHMLYEEEFLHTKGEIQTCDYIELFKNKFKLLGRSSQIFKVAGKRYSTIQIENILENIKDIKKSLVIVSLQTNELRGECLNITIESKKTFLLKDIKKILKNELSNIKFSINLKIVDTIPSTSLGKKIMIT